MTLAVLCVSTTAATKAADSPTAFDPVESTPNWQPPARIEFIRDVVPALTKSGCNAGACHGSFQGRGGLQLSLLGFDPAWDYEVLAKSARGRRVSPAAPENSLLLAKPTGRVPHQGGVRFESDSPAYLILRQWIAEGLPAPGGAGLSGIKLRVEPPSLRLAPGAAQQLRVLASWPDGVGRETTRDVTAWTLLDSREPDVADVTRTGMVAAKRSGRTALTIRYLGQVASVPVTAPLIDGPTQSGDFAVRNFIDERAADEWKTLGLAPGPRASDAEFHRRVSLDLIGTLPTADEAAKFLADSTPDKRARLIDSLLERPEYVDYWSMRWGDLLRAHRRYLGEKGLATYNAWIRRQVRENRPLDQLARDLLTAQGNLYTSGPVGFYFIDEKVEDLTESAAQVLLGVRLQCTRCHHHPQEVWSQEDYYGLAAFFTRLETKDSGTIGSRFGGPKSLRWIARPNPQRQPKMIVEPRIFGVSALGAEGHTTGSSSSAASVPPPSDVRRQLADWLTKPDNPFFARNMVNRYWAAIFGRGLVEPVDDLRATNPPAMPALYESLAQDFVANGYDAKRLLKLIANSDTYQRAIELRPSHDEDGRFLTHRTPRRLSAELLLDAVNAVAESSEKFDGVPPGTRAIALPDPTIVSYFLTTFGRPLRNSPCECARGSSPDLSQTLHLVNSQAMHQKVTNEQGRIARLLKSNRSDDEIAGELYLAAFSRRPTDDERNELRQLLADSSPPDRAATWQDILWALLNSAEFSYR